MPTVARIRHLRRALAERLERLHETLDELIQRVHEAVAQAVGQAVAAAVRDAILTVLRAATSRLGSPSLPGWSPKCFHSSWSQDRPGGGFRFLSWQSEGTEVAAGLPRPAAAPPRSPSTQKTH
jgi:hypothetical protein